MVHCRGRGFNCSNCKQECVDARGRMNSIRTFDDVRRMSDEDFANWLGKIWETGWQVARLGSPITNCPNFYERLGGKND